MAEAVSITFATRNQALKPESSFPYHHLPIPLLETHDWIDLLLKRDGMEGEINREENFLFLVLFLTPVYIYYV